MRTRHNNIRNNADLLTKDRQSKRKWAKNNKAALVILAQRYRARKLQAEGSYNAEDIARQYRLQGGLCYWCSEPLAIYHSDHIIPLSRGGSNWPSNIVCSCPSCNSHKTNKLPYTEWAPPNPLNK